ncbi:tannase/feruloyl esterase family alpha/beta hydrolase [Marinomonas sp. TI.3.20]|uniref:tannase/feruloyl esterase family alpha/beta hydrolase n=1 Tax=Marinomonas sp. TI.3.20 TaxID=3121296 RepID=UPI00311F2111
MMKALFLVPLFCFLLVTSSFANAMACSELKKIAPEGIQISATRYYPDGKALASFCLVRGQMDHRIGIDGKPYSLKFELRLPDYWQGRFAYQFNSGNDGEVKPALGNVTGLLPAQYAINRGFAVVSSNGGHDAEPISQAGLDGSALFGRDPQARRDYGYDAVRKLYPVARMLIQNYYGAPIRYSYGIGSSNGGRMAIVAAARYPRMFDGLLVGYPGLDLPKAALQFAWDAQALHRVALTKRDLVMFTKSLLDQCDGLDGIKDDLIFASDSCQQRFKPSLLACKGEFDRYCLAPEKVAALMRMQQGPKNSKGQALYSDWVYDTGIRSENWRRWKIQSTVNVWQFKPISDVLGAAALANIFMTPPVHTGSTPGLLEAFLLAFNFDKDAPKIYAKNSQFPESAMNFMTSPGANGPKLQSFKQNGGKMVIFHGNSDPVFSVKNTIRWYNDLNFNQEGKADSFVRLYRIPGMPHGEGGPSLDRFDMLLPLMQWVERKQAPNTVIATARPNNPELTNRMQGLERPLCPYPRTAIYQRGSVNLASSFVCRSE